MKKKSAEDYLDNLLNSVNDEKEKREKYKETAKMLEDAMNDWEPDGSDESYESVGTHQSAMNQENLQVKYAKPEKKVKKKKKSASENELDALLSSAKNTEFGMNKRRFDANPMYSRRVSKSEADFLREFEAELLAEDDDFTDLWEEFKDVEELEGVEEKERIPVSQQPQVPQQSQTSQQPQVAQQPQTIKRAEMYQEPQISKKEDSFSMGDVDLAALVNEVAGVMTPSSDVNTYEGEDADSQSIIVDDIPDDVFADFFGSDDSKETAGDAEVQSQEQDFSDTLDLGNLGEEDLLNLLAGAEDLADIGDMLSNGESADSLMGELDAFEAFAESEMAAQQISAEPVAEETGEKKKKGGLLGKLKGVFEKIFKDDEDDVVLTTAKAPTAEALSSENADILAELEDLEGKGSKKAEKKDKKEKKKKEKAPKKPKEPKKPKPPKPKKEKKPKEVDNTPPLPKGPVFMIWLMVGSLVALVLLGVNFIKYNTPITNAKSLQNQGHYAEAFAELDGLKIKEKDMELYNQLSILSTVDSEIHAYEIFAKAEMQDKAFDSLICAAGRTYINEEDADVYGCLGQLEILKKYVSTELEQKYQMTYDEAINMYNLRDRDDYTIALYKKLTELGIEWE